MRQNILSAITQLGASLGIAFLSIAIFRFLTPDQIAFLRQHYFVPFALVTALTPANQNHLRSILFSRIPSTDVWRDINSLVIVQLISAAILLVIVTLSINTAGTNVSWLNIAALAIALILILTRTIVTGILEFRGHYSVSIILNNSSSAIPYIAAFCIVFSFGLDNFFTTTIWMNILCIFAMIFFAKKFSCLLSFQKPKYFKFNFNFYRYFNLSLISLGSVAVYQGVEFSLYNYTSYSKSEIANFGLAFSISAIIRQIILTAVQPLEREHNSNSDIKIPIFTSLSRKTAIEIIIYILLFTSVLILPSIMKITFPNFGMAAIYILPLTFGILGSAIQQIYSVRMITLARTSFLGNTQILLAIFSIAAVVFLNQSFSMLHIIWMTSFFIWLRGCIIIPFYAEFCERNFSLKLWATRSALSASILWYSF